MHDVYNDRTDTTVMGSQQYALLYANARGHRLGKRYRVTRARWLGAGRWIVTPTPAPAPVQMVAEPCS